MNIQAFHALARIDGNIVDLRKMFHLLTVDQVRQLSNADKIKYDRFMCDEDVFYALALEHLDMERFIRL